MILHRQKPISHCNFHQAVALPCISQDAHWQKQSDDTDRIDTKREVTKKTIDNLYETISLLDNKFVNYIFKEKESKSNCQTFSS